MSVLLLFAAFVVDIGVQRVGRADMQTLADVVALDLAREINGRTVTQLEAVEQTLANESRDRNKDVIGYVNHVPELQVDWGKYVNGAFMQLSGSAKPTAVKVTAQTTVAFALSGITGDPSGGASRDAVAIAEGGACFALGSYAARLNTGASPLLAPLLGALGSNIALSAVDYNGLANTDVKLVDLLGVKLGAGTIESVIDGDQLISLGSFYAAMASALGKNNTATVSLLQTLSTQVGSKQIRLSDIIGLTTGSGSGLDADLNVLDLVTAAASAANGSNAVSVPQLGLSLPPLANLQASLSVIEPPKQACGKANDEKATATSTQVSLTVSTTAADVSVPGLLRTQVALSGTVSLAQARAKLTAVRCNPAGISAAVSDGLLAIDLSLEVTVYAKVLGISIPVVSGPIKITGSSPRSGSANVNISQDSDYDVGHPYGTGNSGLPNLTTDTSGLQLIGLPVGVVLAPIVNSLLSGLVNPLVQNLDDELVAPLLNSLGLDISGADLFVRRTPTCERPRLVE